LTLAFVRSRLSAHAGVGIALSYTVVNFHNPLSRKL
jgi:hypothetical protein